MIKVRRGLDLPITGTPEQVISEGPVVGSVGIVGPNYHGMKPTMTVKVGDKVKCGDLLFTDKKTEGVRFTAPASGTVSAINRGARRVLESVVIAVEGDESVAFTCYGADALQSLDSAVVREQLNAAGLWTALRTRPYSKVPALEGKPAAIFVTAIDTTPLAANPEVVLADQAEAFIAGLHVLAKLTDGPIYTCKAPNADIPEASGEQFQVHEFAGGHPAGLTGTHIHFLEPVNANKTVWTISYQEVAAYGILFSEGRIETSRVIALAGPQVLAPKLIRTRLGANIDELIEGQLKTGDNRIITGSVFGGLIASGTTAFLGRYNNQVTVLLEGTDRPFLHYMRAGFNLFSVMNIYVSKLFPAKRFDFTTTTAGSERAMVPVGAYEKVMPLDILPTQLLRALIVGDTEVAQQLGCLELAEEDLALCTFVCQGKYEYGPILRDNLTRIEQEG